MKRIGSVGCTLGLATLFLVAACGGKTTDSTQFSTGLPSDEKLGGLSGEEQGRLCTSIVGYLRGGAGDSLCKLSGFAAASLEEGFSPSPTETDLQKTCVTARDTCLKDRTSDASAGSADCKLSALKETCNATVGEYEACVTEQFSTVEKLLAQIPDCSALTPSGVTGPAASQVKVATTGPACQLLEAHCPGAFGDDASGSSSSVSDYDGGPGAAPSGYDGGAYGRTCGDGVAGPGEECDGTDLRGATCLTATMGAFAKGVITCTSTCQLDFSGCSN